MSPNFNFVLNKMIFSLIQLKICLLMFLIFLLFIVLVFKLHSK